MKHTTEIEIKKWQSRLASAIEDKEVAERKLRELAIIPGNRYLISPPNCDDENGSIYNEFTVYWVSDIFILYGNEGCWPNLNKIEHIKIKPIEPAPAAPKPEVVPPDNLRPVIVVLSGLGKKIGKYFKSRDEWAIMYDDSFQFGPLRFGDIVEDWKEIE